MASSEGGAVITGVSFEVNYEDPSMSLKGLEKLKQALSATCRISSGASWLLASCSTYVVKARVVLRGGLESMQAPRAVLSVVLEGESEELVKVSGLLLAVSKETGGGVIMT